jgi:hypothetical protein
MEYRATWDWARVGWYVSFNETLFDVSEEKKGCGFAG